MAALAVTVALAPQACPPQPPAGGVVVEAVGKGGAAARAGLRPGDVLLSWRRDGGTEGPLETVFDFWVLEYDDAGRGATTLIAARGWRRVTVSLPGGQWRLQVRPSLTESRLVRHREALRLAREGHLVQAAQAWRALAQETPAGGGETCWFLARAGDAFLRARRSEDAKATFVQAREHAAATDARLVAALWDEEGNAHDRALRHSEAMRAYREALALHAAAGRTAQVARLHRRLSRIAFARDDYAGATFECERALDIERSMAAHSLDVADALLMLGWIAEQKGDPVEAESRFRQALEVGRSAAPASTLVAETLRSLGTLAANRGDMTTAEALYLQAIPIYEARGHRTGAAATLQSLGGLLRDYRDDLEGAADLYRRALVLAEAEGARGNALSNGLTNLGIMALRRGDLRQAEEMHHRSMAVSSQENPQGLGVAVSLHNLGRVAEARADWAGAEELFRRSLAMKRKLGLGNRSLSNTLFRAGEAAARRGDLRSAETLHTEALDVRRRFGPGSALEAESLHALCRLARQKNDPAAALRFCLAALESLERQRGRQRRSDAGEGLGATYSGFYRDTMDLLLAEGRREEALHVLERSRARALLTLVAERDLVFAADVDPALLREQKRLETLYDQAQEKLGGLSPARDKDGTQADALRARLGELRAARTQVAARIRQAAPRLAALQDPQPLDARGVRGALDAGTALVSFSVGADRTVVFVSRAAADAAGPPLSVYTVGLGEDALRQRVQAFRGLVERGREGGPPDAALATQAERLYGDLLGPAESALSGSRRLLLSPDGPLHALPFAALVRRLQPLEYLAEWKPLHVVVSASVYAELRRTRVPTGAPTLVAFGDPRPQTSPAASAEGPSVVARARRLAPLGASATEVNDIAALFGEEARAHLGDEATESRAKAVGSARYVHFACHGLIDARSPLDSALALSPTAGPGGDNGLLQAWEVFDSVRLGAELVTLSACETGLGKEMGGEGLIGLTRAFQYAGARSVVASLWAISDRSTATLMRGFYERLRAGAAKDEALQAAQVALIRGVGATAHPFHWAAFQVNGDWR